MCSYKVSHGISHNKIRGHEGGAHRIVRSPHSIVSRKKADALGLRRVSFRLPVIAQSGYLQSMPTLATTVDGLKLPEPFHYRVGAARNENLNVIAKAFREGGARSRREGTIQPRRGQGDQCDPALRRSSIQRTGRK
jgi:hypothetical protein